MSQTRTLLHHRLLPLSVVVLTVFGCTSTTTVRLSPSPQEPVCDAAATALIRWQPAWRADQKDVPAREAAAADGIRQFFERSGCFGSTSLERLPRVTEDAVRAEVADPAGRHDKVIFIAVRELGPTVRIGTSLALVEGGTEVVLDVSEFMQGRTGRRTFTVEWRSGGPGVLKGVASLAQDMQAALAAALQPAAQ